MADTRFVKLRDVLVAWLRDGALTLAQIDMSDPAPPELSEPEVTTWVRDVANAIQEARARGAVVPEGVAIYANPSYLAAANRFALQHLRLALGDGTTVTLSPPPPSYTLGSIEQEIERAAAEAQPTEKLSAERMPEVLG